MMGGVIFPAKILQVNHIERGINPPSVNEIYFTGDYLLKGVRIGIVAGMIALTVSRHLLLTVIVTNDTCASIYLIHSNTE